MLEIGEKSNFKKERAGDCSKGKKIMGSRDQDAESVGPNGDGSSSKNHFYD
jgi:hypothetical protein